MSTRSFWAGDASVFLGTASSQILGSLAARVSVAFRGDERQQMRAWERQVQLLKEAVSRLQPQSRDWGVLIELPLHRLSRRIDTVVLIRDQVACLEFKIGADSARSEDVAQVEDYALCLRDFHEGSRGLTVAPILCVERGPAFSIGSTLEALDSVRPCVQVSGDQLASALWRLHTRGGQRQLAWRQYDAAGYNPTPPIVTAARELYAGHTVEEIGRADASAQQLRATSRALADIASRARRRSHRSICFVTGVPGSGKTLLGLNLAFGHGSGQVLEEPAALLSGNRPLVHVLREAIAQDAGRHSDVSMQEARRQAQQALQTLLGYLKEYVEFDGVSVEPVIVFDEAQRAWDETIGNQLMGRLRSEPQLFLEILGRREWSCLVCLVGSGQEINRGEGGLPLWGEALAELPGEWRVHVSPLAKEGPSGLLGTLRGADLRRLRVIEDERLHLGTSVRSYRDRRQGEWVEALLEGKIGRAREIARLLRRRPAVVARNLEDLRGWLRPRRRGRRRVGLFASAKAVRLVAEGLPPSPRSNELDRVAHWFLRETGDFRSSNALEMPLSEFVCQGLEVDYAGVIWGNDLTWRCARGETPGGKWLARSMSAPHWRVVRKGAGRQYRLNAYRVLLTRAREDMAIMVPRGDPDDATRSPSEFEAIHRALCEAGCSPLEGPKA